MIIRYGITFVVLLLFACFEGTRIHAQNKTGELKSICIDAGHGGADPGAVGAKTYEKHIVLDVALKVGAMIQKNYPEIKVLYTREKDVFVDLKDRTKMANNAKADLFISIHANAVTNKNVKGIETFVLGTNGSAHNLQVAMRENSVIKYEEDYSVKYAGFDPSKPESYIIFNLVRNLHLDQSLNIASCVHEELMKMGNKIDRKVQQGSLWVLKDAAMPSILLEIGFISNAEEERFMMSEGGQDKIASSIFRGFVAYKNKMEKSSGKPLSKDRIEERPEIAENAETEVATVKPDNKEFFYAVQVASGVSRIKDPKVPGTGEQVNELQTGDRYRYYIGEADCYDQVRKYHSKVKKDIDGCFIIAVYKGAVISVAEALKLEKKQN